MSLRIGRAPFTRGTSVLAALVFVAVLSTIAFAVHEITPGNAGVAQSAATTAATDANLKTNSSTPPIPNCTDVKEGSHVEIPKADSNEKQACVCVIPPTSTTPKQFQSLKYTVKAALSGGSANAETTVYKTGKPAAQNESCQVEVCPPGVDPGKPGCKITTQSGTSLTGALQQSGSQVIKDFPELTAQSIAAGTLDASSLNGKINSETQKQIMTAFQDLKTSNVPQYGIGDQLNPPPYNASQIQSAEKEIQNIGTCVTQCKNDFTPPSQTAPTPTNPVTDATAKDISTLASAEDVTASCAGKTCTAVPETVQQQKYLEQNGYDCNAGAGEGAGIQCTKPYGGSTPSTQNGNSDSTQQNSPSYDAFGSLCSDPKADKSTCPPGSGAPAPSQQCPAGQIGTPPNCKAAGPTIPTVTGPNNNGILGNGLLGNNGGLTGGLSGFLQGLMRGMGLGGQQRNPNQPIGNQVPQPPGTCAPNYVCQNNTMYMRNNQCVDQIVQTCQYGCNGSQCATSPQTQCPPPPPQPDPSACPNGAWQQQTSTIATGQSCLTGWQCVPGASQQPTAQITCSPDTIDLGSSVAISWQCGNSQKSEGLHFSSGGQLSGSTSTPINSLPQVETSAAFGIACIGNQNAVATSTCSVQVGRPGIVFTASPKTVSSGGVSVLGWTTSGMDSCIVSSPDQPDFTTRNAGLKSTSGVATSSPMATSTHFTLTCQTLGGQTKVATTSVTVSATSGGVSIHSSIDGTNVAHGAPVSITWQSAHAPSGSGMSLWLFDIRTNTVTGLIAGGLNTNGTYTWTIPQNGAACSQDSAAPCASDLVPGRQYGIEAALYTPRNAYLGGPDTGAPDPQYLDFGYTDPQFTVSQ